MASRPKQAVAKGGMWSTKPQNISKETSDLLKVMMDESKLTNFQRRKLQDDVKYGKSLPVQCLPTSSRTTGPKPKPKESKKSSARPFAYSGKRRKEIIDILKERNKDDYKPTGGKCITEKDKQRLQNIMAFGKDSPQHLPKPKRPPVAMIDEPEIDRFEEVMAEIEDRRRFLDEMEALGQGKKYRTIISTEISQKIRELELIDKERSEDLEATTES